ncbi:MAG: O-antigen ligase family protein [Patescibacteria group bacterium]
MKINFHVPQISGRHILDGLIEASYLAVILLIPLWFAYWFPTYNIFEFNKMVLFRSLVWLLLFFTAIKVIFYPPTGGWPPRQFFKKYWLWPTIFIISLSLSLVGSIDPIQSFYGTLSRQQGLSSQLFYFLWFILLSFNLIFFNSSEAASSASFFEVRAGLDAKIRRIIITASISGFIVASYGILQALNIDFLNWAEAPFLTRRSFSTFGQPNFLASWLLLVVPLSLHLFFKSRHFFIRSLWLLVASLQLICLFLTGSRAGLVALVATIFLFLAYLFIFAGWSRRKKYWLAGIFIIIVFASATSISGSSGRSWSEVINFNYGSAGARINFYRAALEAIPSRLFFGFGLENSQEVFIKYYEPDWGVYGDVSQIADRAHNLFLDILLTTGVVGLFSFVILYYFFYRLVFDNTRKQRSAGLSLALALGVSAYLLSLLFGFAMAAGEIYFWLFLALLVALNSAGESRLAAKTVSRRADFPRRLPFKIFLILLAAIAIFWQVRRNLDCLIADYYFFQADLALNRQEYFAALAIIDHLADQPADPASQEFYHLILGERLSAIYPTLIQSIVKREIQEKLEALDRSLGDQGYRQLLARAEIKRSLGDFVAARGYLSQLAALTPYWPPVQLAQGRLELAAGDKKKSLLAYYSASLNLPDVNDQRLNEDHRRVVLRYRSFIYGQIASIYESERRYPLAARYYQDAYRDNPDDLSLLKKVADAYYQAGDLPQALVYTKHGFSRDPADYHWPWALALLYHGSGDREQATFYINRAWLLASDKMELESLYREYNK